MHKTARGLLCWLDRLPNFIKARRTMWESLVHNEQPVDAGFAKYTTAFITKYPSITILVMADCITEHQLRYFTNSLTDLFSPTVRHKSLNEVSWAFTVLWHTLSVEVVQGYLRSHFIRPQRLSALRKIRGFSCFHCYKAVAYTSSHNT